MNGLPILSIVTFLPLLGALVVGVLPARYARSAGLTAALATWVVSLVLAAGFSAAAPGFSFVEEQSWIPAFGIEYKLGVDGLSLVLVILTTKRFHRHQPVFTGITDDDPALQIGIESRRLDLRHAELPALERPTVHAFDVQVIVFIEREIESVQPVDLQHVAMFEGVEQGVVYGSHGSQSLNGKGQ